MHAFYRIFDGLIELSPLLVVETSISVPPDAIDELVPGVTDRLYVSDIVGEDQMRLPDQRIPDANARLVFPPGAERGRPTHYVEETEENWASHWSVLREMKRAIRWWNRNRKVIIQSDAFGIQIGGGSRVKRGIFFCRFQRNGQGSTDGWT